MNGDLKILVGCAVVRNALGQPDCGILESTISQVRINEST